nr:hypothetical protein [Bordetella sp. LUAb4]
MLGAAPKSLAVFAFSLPFALLVSRLYQPSDCLFVLAALVNLIAFARTTFAWHRVVNQRDAKDSAGADGSTGEARHLVLLAAITIAVAALGRATGDVPYILYVVMNAPADAVFFGTLIVLLALIWVPVLYALAVYGLTLPRTALTGDYGFRGIRAAMPYKRWPLMLMLLVLVSVAGLTYGFLYELKHDFTATGPIQALLGTILCVLIAFVVTTMYAVAYRDSVVESTR